MTIPDVQQVQKEKREYADARKAEGNTLFTQEKYSDALEKYEEAIGTYPDCFIYYSNAAACCLKLKEAGRALLFAEEAIRLSPESEKAIFRRACAKMQLLQWREAIVDFKSISNSSPEIDDSIKQCERELQKIAFAKAIHVETFQLTARCVAALPLPDTYVGPIIDADGPITVAFCHELISYFREEKRLPPRIIYRILLEAKSLFEACPSLVDITMPDASNQLADFLHESNQTLNHSLKKNHAGSEESEPKITVCGDVHGQFFDLTHMFELNGFPSEMHTYLFNGDIVDRGQWSLEVALLLLAFKAALPRNFFVARGNHETETVNRMHGFFDEVRRKYPGDERMFAIFNQVLHALPLAHVIGGKYFVVHGGLPANAETTLTLADIRDIKRFCVPDSGSVMSQLLWSDPQDALGISPSHRGEGILFGPDITKAFLDRNGLECIIRSHVWEAGGYKEHHGGQCITIFSAPNYTGSVSDAAVINMTGSEYTMSFRSFSAAPVQGKAHARARAANLSMFH